MIPEVRGWLCQPGRLPGALRRALACRRWGFQRALIFGLLWVASPLRAEVFLRANQVGYGEHDLKVAVALSGSALPDTFSVIDVHTGATVFVGKTLPLAGERWGKFDQLAELDFTSVSKQGRYELRFGGSRSLPFAIDQRSLADLPDTILEFLRQQRCGYNPWLRADVTRTTAGVLMVPCPPERRSTPAVAGMTRPTC